MLTLQQIKVNPQEVIDRLAIKGFDGAEPIARAIALDDRRRQLQLENDNQAARLNKIAASIGALMKQGKRDEADEAKKEVGALKESQRIIAEELDSTAAELHELLCTIPNLPCAMVPEGKTAADNVVEKTGGPMPDLPADALPHWELAKKYNLIDFDLGVK
ncbi:MAG: serine--tRNA ligase, partial [Muribaculaceae bacterium]